MEVILVIAAVIAATAAYGWFRGRRRLDFIETFVFPEALRRKIKEQHPQLSREEAERVLEGLREWFIACAHRDKEMIGMPSRVVDDAWHEFILMTRRYHEFCDKAFGRYLHHTPSAISDTPVRPAIPRTLELLDRVRRPTPAAQAAGGLPLIFTIDSDLAIEGGRDWTRESVADLENDAGGGDFGGGGCSGADGCSGGDGCGGCGGCCG